MGSFFLLILIIFFAIIGLIGSFILRFLRLFTKQTSGFGGGRSTQNSNSQYQQRQSGSESNHQKVFSKEEGEYVDYEEVK